MNGYLAYRWRIPAGIAGLGGIFPLFYVCRSVGIRHL